jgi:hypothetical protein
LFLLGPLLDVIIKMEMVPDGKFKE